MEFEGKEKKIYHGIAIPFIIMVVLPAIFYFMFFGVFKTFTKQPEDICVYMALGFSGLVGTLFDISCVIAGFIHEFFVSMFLRIGKFFSEIKIFKGKAVKWYFDDFVESGGIILWIFFIILAATIFVCVFGFVKFGIWYATK